MKNPLGINGTVLVAFLSSATIAVLKRMNEKELMVLARTPNQGPSDLDQMLVFLLRCCDHMSLFAMNMTGHNEQVRKDYANLNARFCKLHRSVSGYGGFSSDLAAMDSVYAIFSDCVKLCGWTLAEERFDDGDSYTDALGSEDPTDPSTAIKSLSDRVIEFTNTGT